MHLTDTTFGEIKRQSDFLHRHLFVVVEDDDQSFGTGQALGDQPLEVLSLHAAQRILLTGVLDDVDLTHVLAGIGLEPLPGQTRPHPRAASHE